MKINISLKSDSNQRASPTLSATSTQTENKMSLERAVRAKVRPINPDTTKIREIQVLKFCYATAKSDIKCLWLHLNELQIVKSKRLYNNDNCAMEIKNNQQTNKAHNEEWSEK